MNFTTGKMKKDFLKKMEAKKKRKGLHQSISSHSSKRISKKTSQKKLELKRLMFVRGMSESQSP